jgi:hypothetical protein
VLAYRGHAGPVAQRMTQRRSFLAGGAEFGPHSCDRIVEGDQPGVNQL